MVVHIPDTLEIVVLSSDDELMEDLKENPGEDLEFTKHQIVDEVEEVESSASDNIFASGRGV